MSPKKRRALIVGGAVALAAAALLAAWLLGAFAPAWGVAAPSETLIEAAAGLDAIVIDADYDPQSRVLAVTQRLTLTNRTGKALDVSVLRAWPNAFQSAETSPAATEEFYDLCYSDGFSLGALQISAATVAGKPVSYRYEDAAKTVLALPLDTGWQAGETIELELRYRIIVPKAKYRFGVWGDLCVLGNAFVVPAAHENGAWRTDEYGMIGDPFVTDCANYVVTVRVPEGYDCAGSGAPEAETADGVTTFRFDSLAIRDFALVIDKGLHTARGMQNGVALTAYAKDASKAREALGYMQKAMACYAERFGAYPYQSYACAVFDFPVGGMEYPQLSMVDESLSAQSNPTLEYVVAHETAHQWWYAVVGSDEVNEAWQDEALCEFSTLEYYDSAYGREARDDLEKRNVQSAMLVTVAGDVSPGAPLSYFDSMSQYALVVYNRGAALFCALDKLLDGNLDAALRAYYQQYAFSRATRQDFETLVGRVTGEDIAPLMLDYLDTKLSN